jgi:hypothetical protein
VRLKFERNDGKTVVLKQNHAANYALFFSDKNRLVNAHNLEIHSKESHNSHAEIEIKLFGVIMKRDMGNNVFLPSEQLEFGETNE